MLPIADAANDVGSGDRGVSAAQPPPGSPPAPATTKGPDPTEDPMTDELAPCSTVDDSEFIRAPADWRGTWVQGTKGNGTFKFFDIPENRESGLAGREFEFKGGYSRVGGFPSEFYYQGSREKATVEIDGVKGNDSDFTAADEEMRNY